MRKSISIVLCGRIMKLLCQFILVCLLLSLFASSAVGDIYRSVHMGGNWGTNEESMNPSFPPDYFEFFHSLNVDWVGISVALHVNDSLDSTVERKYSDVDIPTFTDEFLRQLIQAFRHQGFQVYLTLAFEEQEAAQAEHPVERHQLGDPNMPDIDPAILPEFWPWSLDHPDHQEFVAEFWDTYTQQAVHFAQIAEDEGVELYSLGTETEGLFRSRSGGDWPNDFGAQLQTMVSAVRAVYRWGFRIHFSLTSQKRKVFFLTRLTG